MNIHNLGATPSLTIFHPIDETYSSIGRRLEAWMIATLDALLAYLEGQRERQFLESMSDRELKDIGLSRSSIGAADAESSTYR